MSKFVKRDGENNIIAIASRPQPGWPVEVLPDDAAEILAYQASLAPAPVSMPAWIEARKEAYRSRIAAFKGVPDASQQDVLGFVLDAEIAARQGDPIEADKIAGIVAQVKIDIQKPS